MEQLRPLLSPANEGETGRQSIHPRLRLIIGTAMEAVNLCDAGEGNVNRPRPLMRPAQIKNPKRIVFRWIAEERANRIAQFVRDGVCGIEVVKFSPLALSPKNQAVNTTHGGNPRARCLCVCVFHNGDKLKRIRNGSKYYF